MLYIYKFFTYCSDTVCSDHAKTLDASIHKLPYAVQTEIKQNNSDFCQIFKIYFAAKQRDTNKLKSIFPTSDPTSDCLLEFLVTK